MTFANITPNFYFKAGFVLILASFVYIISFWIVSNSGIVSQSVKHDTWDPVAAYIRSSYSAEEDPPADLDHAIREIKLKLTRFDFVKDRSEGMRRKIVEMDDKLSDMKNRLSEVTQDREALRHTVDLKNIRDARRLRLNEINGSKRNSSSVVVFTFASDEDIESIRTLVGSLHHHYHDPIPQTVLFTYNLTGKYSDEFSYWRNVDVIDASHLVHFQLDRAQVSRYSNDRLVRVFIKLLAERYVGEAVDTFIYLNSTVYFQSSDGLEKLDARLKSDGMVISKSDTGSWDVFAITLNNEHVFSEYISKYLLCLQDLIGDCDMSKLINPAVKPFQLSDMGMSKNTTQYHGQPHYCHLKIRPESIYADYFHSSTLKFTLATGKPVLAIGVATTGHALTNATYERSSLLTTLLPSLVTSITEEECDTFEFIVYVGYDSFDPIWDSPSTTTLPLLQQRVKELIEPLNRCVHVDYVRLPYSNGWLTMIWSRLFVKSLRDGATYFYQVNDDLDIRSSGWSSNFTATLDLSPGGVGVVGPYDPKWNCTLLTQAMVRTKPHYSAYKTLYPLEIKDWYSDFWLTGVYDQGLKFCYQDFVAINRRDQGTRYARCTQPPWSHLIQRDKFTIPPPPPSPSSDG